MAFSTGALASTGQQQVADVQVVSPPSDTVSSLNFTPVGNSNLLAASAWSGQVLVWDTGIGQNGQPASQPKAEQRHELVMDSAWFQDGSKIATGGGDRTVKVWDLASNKQMQIGQHDAPVRAVCTLHPQAAAGKEVVVSGGWDKKVRYWDMRESKMIGEIPVDEKVYAMDYKDHTLVVATAEEPASAGQGCNVTGHTTSQKQNSDWCRKIYVIDIRNPGVVKSKDLSPLSYQTRCVAAFPGDAGYLIGSIEGRVGVTNFPGTHPKGQTSYTFKCHRVTRDQNLQVTTAPAKPNPSTYRGAQPPKNDNFDEVHSINDICFHPLGTFVTVGSDGCYITWDKDEKSRLQKPNAPTALPITAASFNSAGTTLAYATGYDWAQGHEYYDPNNANFRPSIVLHKLASTEYEKRGRK